MINVAQERAWRAGGVGCAPSRFRHGRLRWCEWVGCDRREALVSREASSRAENERGRDLACGGVYHVSSGVEDESTAEIPEHTYFLIMLFLPHKGNESIEFLNVP